MKAKQKKQSLVEEEVLIDLLQKAINHIEYFVKRVEEGSIRSNATYKRYKDFLSEAHSKLSVLKEEDNSNPKE